MKSKEQVFEKKKKYGLFMHNAFILGPWASRRLPAEGVRKVFRPGTERNIDDHIVGKCAGVRVRHDEVIGSPKSMDRNTKGLLGELFEATQLCGGQPIDRS